MSVPSAVRRAVEAALLVEPDAAQLETLRERGSALDTLPILRQLELHGVLALVLDNLERAGVELSEETRAHARERRQVLRRDAERSRLTLQRCLKAAQQQGFAMILLKGSSLGVDLYPDPGVRAQGDVDLLVAPSDLKLAMAAGLEAGCSPADHSLPAWWYRLTHFHLKLAPNTALVREIELHWHLHSSALLHTASIRALRERSRNVAVDGIPALDLDPIDRFLHVVTHLCSHWLGSLCASWDRVLDELLVHPRPVVRLKWFLDVIRVIETLEAPVDAVIERAREWSAEHQLLEVLRLLRDGPLLPPSRAEWTDALLSALRAETKEREGTLPRSRAQVNPTFELRLASLRGLPRWIFPPLRYHRRASSLPLVIALPKHATSAVGRLALAAFALPAALLHRAVLRPSRRRLRARCSSPDAILQAVAQSRRALRSHE